MFLSVHFYFKYIHMFIFSTNAVGQPPTYENARVLTPTPSTASTLVMGTQGRGASPKVRKFMPILAAVCTCVQNKNKFTSNEIK